MQRPQGAISRPFHLEPYGVRRGGEAKTIHRALNDDDKLHVVWVKAGHEVFQEVRLLPLPLRVLVCMHAVYGLAKREFGGWFRSSLCCLVPTPTYTNSSVSRS
jgi:hypothetical protein